MKKMFLAAIAALAGFAAQAQYKVGDTYVKDGIKCVVIKVTPDGNHGLLLKLDTKEEMLANYKRAAQAKKDEKEVKDEMKELRKRHMLAVCDLTTLEGKRNMETIEKYCADNGVDMQQVFPDFAQVKALGEGWFIPGDAELAYIHNFISRGYGTKMKGADFKKKIETLRQSEGFEECIFPGFTSVKTPLYGYKSSTWTRSDDSRKDKFNGVMPHCTVCYFQAMGGKHYFMPQTGNLETNVTALAIKSTTSLYDVWHKKSYCAAVCEF